jgi:hypothetical protein
MSQQDLDPHQIHVQPDNIMMVVVVEKISINVQNIMGQEEVSQIFPSLIHNL